jgi:hypothetical protein
MGEAIGGSSSSSRIVHLLVVEATLVPLKCHWRSTSHTIIIQLLASSNHNHNKNHNKMELKREFVLIIKA